MDRFDILLIIISSAGLLHGVAFAIYLCFFKKKKLFANYLLAFILVFMAFRIGKSVMLNFGDNLEPIFIFAGLAFILLIGPLLKWYVYAMTQVNYKLPHYYFLELLPFITVFLLSFFISKSWFETNNKQVIVVFGSILIFIYMHFAFYILLAFKSLKKVKSTIPKKQITKSQSVILSWLNLLLIGFILLWISYVLNILDDAIPYIISPIIYSLVVYFLSFKAFELKVIELDGNVFKQSDDIELFNQILKLIETNSLYLEPTISLSSLSKLARTSAQKTSEVINQYANQNFNDFVNYYRIQEAKKLLLSASNKNFTISSIAFDSGFSSLSSFNSAFKKFEGKTPSAFKKNYNG